MQTLLEGIKRVPYAHQLDAMKRYEKQNHAMLLWEMGTGKTGAAILLARQHYLHEGRLLKTLILAPPVTLNNWKDEWALWSKTPPELINVLSKGSGVQKAQMIKTLAESPDPRRVLIFNYEQMINDNVIKALVAWKPELIILDECHYLKSPTSKRTKMTTLIADLVPKKIMLTGTPILNNVKDIFSQFRILDSGETFGTNYYVFQAKYLKDENAGWANRPNHFPKLVNNEKMFPELTEKIYRKADRKTKDECLDLPPLVKIVEKIPLGKEQRKAYDDMVRDFLAFVKHESDSGKPKAVVASTAIVKAVRLLQIASGFANTDEDTVHEFKENPKLERVKELLEELTPDHKVILWCSYRHNYRMLERVCKELNLPYVLLTGEQNTAEKTGAIYKFQNEKECRVIIANRASGGIGVNLTAADYSIVFSRNFSLGEELQSEARNYRGGSEVHEKITKIDLCSENTIDEDVIKALNSKHQLSAEIIDIVRGGQHG